jgi:uncharacterized RDD family membrane protein YckC/type II secretory pathway pseudopilin PulG
MLNPQLLDYVKQQLAQGINKENIQHNLLSQGGWALSDIDEVFSAITTNIPIAPNTISKTSTPRISEQLTSTQVMEVKYAGFWIRYVAITLDGILLASFYAISGGIFAFTGIITQDITEKSLVPETISLVSQVLITCIYFLLLTYYKGATLGKMMVGIRVQSEDSQKLSFGKVVVREIFGKFISYLILGIGYIMSAFTKKKQAFHDKIAHTVVVYKDPTNKNYAGLIIGIILAAFLPVLAVFGILSSITLASLNSARDKGADTAIKMNLSGIKVQAELYYMNNNKSYIGVCNALASKYGLTDYINNIIKENVTPTCIVSEKSYAVSSPLKSNPSQNYCVDSSGYVGNGIADNNTFSCNTGVSNNIISTSTISTQSQNIIRPDYEYILPAGWQSMPISANHIEAIQDTPTCRSALTIGTTTIETVGTEIFKGISEQNLNQTNIKDLLDEEFTNPTILDTQYGFVGGEKAFISKLNLKESDDSGNIQQLFATQYLTFHNDIFYVIILMTQYPQGGDILTDFQSIINSFKFITNS